MYSIRRTDTAEEGLNHIILYIADTFGTARALEALDQIEDRINLLKDSPYLGTEPRYTLLKRRKYRYLVIDKTLVFYKVNESENIIMIYAIVDSRSDYLAVLKGL